MEDISDVCRGCAALIPATTGPEVVWFENLADAVGIPAASFAVFISAIIALGIALATIVVNQRIARRRATIDHLSRIMWDKDYIEARKVYEEVRDSIGLKALFQMADAATTPGKLQKDMKRAVVQILNEHELIAIGIEIGALDDNAYKMYLKSQYINQYETAKELIEHFQAKQPKAFEKFAGRAKAWKNEGG